MLTLKNTVSKDRVVLQKSSLRTLLQKTPLAYLTEENELASDSLVSFDEVLDTVRATCNDTKSFDRVVKEDAWHVLKEFLQHKTVLHESNLIKKNPGSIDVLVSNIPPQILMERLRLNILPDNTPLIISTLKLESVYEELVFYEYVYSSEHISLHAKLTCMIENNYERLLNLIEEGVLEICTTSLDSFDTTEDSKKSMATIRHTYYEKVSKSKMFDRFIDLHENWLGYNISEIDAVDDRAIPFCVLLNDRMFTTWCSDTILTKLAKISEYVGQNPNKVHVRELCHLNSHYRTDPLRVNILMEHLVPQLDLSASPHETDEHYELRIFKAVDLLVRMMEDDSRLVAKLSTRQKEKIVSMWMKMCSPSHKGFRYTYTCPRLEILAERDLVADSKSGTTTSSTLVQKLTNEKSLSETQFKRTRKLFLSATVRSILSQIAVTFSEIGYVMSTDDFEAFELLCKRMEFKSIQSVFFNHLPPKILNMIIERSVKSNPELNGQLEPPVSIRLDPYELVERTYDQIIGTSKLFKSVFKRKPAIELISLGERSFFVECLYTLMYWDYFTMLLNDPTVVANALGVLACVGDSQRLSNYQLDVTIIRTVVDNFVQRATVKSTATHKLGRSDESTIYLNNEEIFKVIQKHLSELIDVMKRDEMLFKSGPDFTEIRDELTVYGVQNLSFLNEMCDMYNMHADDNYIEQYVQSAGVKASRKTNVVKSLSSKTKDIEEDEDNEDDGNSDGENDDDHDDE
ncbi:hypothetical protein YASMINEVIRUS_215 [Yasminevirus sp. GU-2018]|uniref:Uncharacterized protein n=1 Tax=Yasminevirus sp. GU-2018 TaxID=2420051 RepID=A0A5K0U8M3_9VIRU|nr:hypothetical protein YASMINEVIRUS_215 [Yasminevirus sp. GU-2018]